MKNDLTVLYYLKKGRKDSNFVPIYLRITINGERIEYSTKRKTEIEKWDKNAQRLKGRSEEARQINNFLENLSSSIYKQYNILTESESAIAPAMLRDYLEGRTRNQYFLLKVFDFNNQLMDKEKNSKYTADTIKRYKISIKRLKAFLINEYQLQDIDLGELNYSFIHRYEIFLRSEYDTDHNTAMKYLKHLKKVIHFAMELGYIERDPFMQYKTSYREVNRGYLTADELKRIEEKTFRIKRLDQVRDVFVFACYTGLSYSDLKKLTINSLTKGIDGKNWIIYEREKTGVRASIPLLPPAQAIINKYKNDPECMAENKLLPIRSNQKLNSYLEEIAELCDIQKHTTMHLARHTFATTVTLTNGVPIETVQKMLGHKNLSTTSIYARVVDNKISEDMAKIEEKIKNRTG